MARPASGRAVLVQAKEAMAKAQGFPGTGPIRLMVQDEARFGRIADPRRCGCPKSLRPIVKALVTQEYP